MSNLTLRNVSKVYPNHNCVVRDFNLQIKDREFIIFVGPSGCGKSTTLRMIAGLEEISEGELWIDGELMNYVEPKDRGLSMVFQNYALYPHMTVYGNLAFALKIQKIPKKKIDKQVQEVAEILEISHLLKRYPKELSGGQRQRVAIGSAMIRQPKLFLMDEPLSNLDAKLRAQMRVEIAKLHKELGSTIIYVTHDQTEAMTLGTRIVVMKEGVIQQVDAPQELYQNPVNQFVAGFIGSPSMNFLETSVGFSGDRACLYVEGTELPLSDNASFILKKKGYTAGSIQMGIRPENILSEKLAAETVGTRLSRPIPVKVTARELLGNEVILYFDLEGKQCSARVEPENGTKAGESTKIYLDLNKIYLFDPDTGESLLYHPAAAQESIPA
ncbi:MAG: sn-glycerol-3-phosphate ABC transporter ATP-binding protein UgpC [Eubacteriales bacterium]|nr:sn-glycerol-3-phosphate ABC transporter ATP-binding protein UgpC [Eubacteriales bacterium]